MRDLKHEITAGAVLQAFRPNRSLTRAEVGELTGLSRVTLPERLGALVGCGLLKPERTKASTGGRPASRLAIPPEAGHLLMADVGGSQFRVGVADYTERILGGRNRIMNINDGPDQVLDAVLDELASLTAELELDLEQAGALCIGLPGPVDPGSGRIVRPPMMIGWDGFDVGAYLRRRLPVPVVVDKDMNLMALGEMCSRPAVSDLLVLKVGMGIGAGIITGGRLLRGTHGAAGDLGHLPGRSNELCRCGQVGCLEATASGWSMIRTLQSEGHQVGASAELFALAQQRVPRVLELLRQSGREIGDAVAAAVGMLNPQLIVVGGNLALASDFLLADIRARVFERAHPLAIKDLEIVGTVLGQDAGLTGAARMAADLALGIEAADARVEAWSRTRDSAPDAD